MKYYEQKYQKRRRKKKRILFSFFAILFLLLIVYVEVVVNPLVLETTRHMIFSLSTSAVSDAVYDVLKEENVTYQDLVKFEYDQDGNIKHMSYDSVRMNMIARRFYQVAQIYLDEMGRNGVDVPLGAFTGLPFLSGVGPKINLKLVSIGAMTSTFENSFLSAGINQTNHSIFVHLHASVSMLLPIYRGKVDSETQMLVAESVIVGKVPQVFFEQGSMLKVDQI